MSIEFPCQNCYIDLTVQDEVAGKSCRCAKCGELVSVPIPKQKHVHARAGLTFGQRVGEAIKLYAFIVIVSFALMCLFEPIGMIVFVAFTMWLIMVLLGWIGTSLVMKFFYGNDPQYQQYLDGGGSPFWDSIWGAPSDYTLPFDEPSYDREFVPPRSWGFQCLSCFARVEHPNGRCWNCGIRLSAKKKRFPMDF